MPRLTYDALERVGEPAAEPIHLTEAKLHIRQDDTADDALIPLYLAGVREHFEDTAGLTLVTTTFRASLCEWPCGGVIVLPRPPLVSVDSITYTLEDGTVETLSSSSYVVDTASQPGRVLLKNDESWPSDELQVGLPIAVTYKAGILAPVSAVAATDLLTVSGRTLADGTAVQLANSGGGLPGGLSERTTYYVRDASGSSFKLAATSGGAAIDITSAGSGTHFVFTGSYPRQALQALRFLLGHWYEYREAVLDTGRRELIPLPLAYQSLLYATRNWSR